ncbi:PfkB family carbohydrate kinase [Formosa sp. A9]|uniref:PfkB family carbohydrate kinase n=1 Tax=Formosa sp. A9 TaxID=3442641 RepID=UPI003EBF288F
MSKVITFGEIMLRLSTERFLRFSQASNFQATYGGGEFNVAVALANFGLDSAFVTRIPNNDIGACALQEMHKKQVGTEHVVVEGDRLGIYFLETGAGTRSSKVVYDRANSAMATITDDTFDWEEIFKDAKWFHWSGITPAISQSAAQVCLLAVKAAHKRGIPISTDLNYRSKLWQYGKQPHEVMPELLQYSTIILGDLDTANFMLGKPKLNPDYELTKALPEGYKQVFSACKNLKYMATTLRYSVGASHQRIGGILYDGETLYRGQVKDVTPVVDRVGSGDAFMGGLIYGLIQSANDHQKVIDTAVACCCLKHTIFGDYNLITLNDVEQFLSGDLSAKVSR